MSFYDDASLVVIPSAQKTSKLYAVKPTDGSGDLAFTRTGDTATRVNSAGLIEKVRTNLILQSEAFNTTWTPNAAPTITANTTVAPNGTTTADTIASTASNSGVYQVPTVASGVEHSFSVYIKNITTATNLLIGCDLGPINGFLNFNAVTGAITSTAAGITGSSVTDAGNGWYRVAGTYVSTGTTNTFVIFGQSGMTFAAWGAQFESGVATSYIPTTTAAVSVGPVANVPRLDYLGSTCPRLLLEPQRTNLVTYSEQLNNAAWTKDGATVTANTAVSPDGYTNADKVLETATTAVHNVYQAPTLSSNVYSFSVFVKKAERFKCALADRNSGAYVAFNINTGVIIESLVFSGKIESYSNDWYRLTITTPSAYSVFDPQVFILPDSYTTGVPALITYAGSATSGLFVWGCQLEQGAYSTSLIPTLAASATRGADACSKTGISSLIGQTEGTIFVDIDLPNNAANDIFTFASTGVNDIFLASNGGNLLTRIYYDSNALFFAQYAITAAGGRFKMAIAYKSGDSAFYVNGTLVGTNAGSFAFTATLGTIDLTNNQYAGRNNKNINQTLLFKTRLTNASLAELTTL